MSVRTRGPVAAASTLLVTTLVTALVATLASVLLAGSPSASAATGTRWDCLARYESGHRWAINTGNGYYGGLQFSLSTWLAYGGRHYSHNYWPQRATRREQIVIARRVAWRGWGGHPAQGGRHAWPNTWGRCF